MPTLIDLPEYVFRSFLFNLKGHLMKLGYKHSRVNRIAKVKMDYFIFSSYSDGYKIFQSHAYVQFLKAI